MSAYDWAPIEESAREAGVNSFVAKPFFANSLKAALLSVDKEVQAKTALADPNLYDFTGKRVLLVEDNEFNQEVAKEFLSMANIIIETAENGKIAVDKFVQSPAGHYDAILMDIQMPVMDGYEATNTCFISPRRSFYSDHRDDCKCVYRRCISFTERGYECSFIEAVGYDRNLQTFGSDVQ